jgi:hypothetical protein
MITIGTQTRYGAQPLAAQNYIYGRGNANLGFILDRVAAILVLPFKCNLSENVDMARGGLGSCATDENRQMPPSIRQFKAHLMSIS